MSHKFSLLNEPAESSKGSNIISASVEIDKHSRPDVTELHTEYFGDRMKDKDKKIIRIGFFKY